MKVTKELVKNIVFIVFLGLILFTPLGFYPRVFVSRILSFSPSVIEETEQDVLSSYQWRLSDLEGNTLDFKDLKGKVIFVNFWATWCPPCVAEMPSLQSLYNDYGDKIEFVIVTNEDRGKVDDFLVKNKYGFPVYFERNSSPVSLSSVSIPATYLIDSNGKIVIKKVGAADWNSDKLRNTLDGLLKSIK